MFDAGGTVIAPNDGRDLLVAAETVNEWLRDFVLRVAMYWEQRGNREQVRHDLTVAVSAVSGFALREEPDSGNLRKGMCQITSLRGAPATKGVQSRLEE